MERAEYRNIIKFLVLSGKKSKEIIETFHAVYGASAPSAATIKRWVLEVKRGRPSLGDEPRSGRPATAVTPKNIDTIDDLIKDNRRISFNELVQRSELSRGTVERIIHDHLGMSKVSARWVPKMLTTFMKNTRVEISKELLARFTNSAENFLERLVTCDETWIYHFDPESKQESKEWRHPSSPPPIKFKVSKTSKKIMMTVFWDRTGIIYIDYLPHGKTITGAYYADVLEKLRLTIKEKRRGKLRRGVLLQQDNAPAHTSRIALAAAADCGFEVISHPPYSPDLAPSDYHLFSNLKKFLRGRRFTSDEELKSCVEDWFSGLPAEFFETGLNALKKRWEKCIALQGEYVEK